MNTVCPAAARCIGELNNQTSMAERSMETGLEYRKVPFMIDAPPLNVVQEGRLLKGAKALFGFTCPQASRFLLILLTYTAGLTVSFWLAYQFRFDFAVPPPEQAKFHAFVAWVVPVKLSILLLLVQFDGLLSYFSVPDLRRLFTSLAAGTGILALLWWGSDGQVAPPRGVILADLLISLLVISSMRLGFRLARERYVTPAPEWHERVERVGIIGAGDVGASLVRELSMKSHLGLRPVVFFDDDPQKWHCRVHNIPVIGSPESLLHQKNHLRLDRIILAIPSASKRRCREIGQLLQKIQIRFDMVPSYDQLATGQVKALPLRTVRPDELFGTQSCQLDRDRIQEFIKNRVVLVTGAGGRVGSELCRQVAAYGPRQLLVLEQCEVQIFQIEQELIRLGHQKLIVPLVADILDQPRMESLFRRFRPDIVFHAAGHHHAAVMEKHPSEAIKANCLGAAQTAQLALACEASAFVLVSTDRAQRPDTVVGASKRLAELTIRSLAGSAEQSTRFNTVRMAGLIGSSDRIIQRFHQQIEQGGPLQIPDPNAICHSMTLNEAAALALQSAATARNGELFTFDLGQPIKLLQLAHRMIELSGLKPDEDVEIEFTGYGPAIDGQQPEKAADSRFVRTAHPRILAATLPYPSWHELKQMLSQLAGAADRAEPQELIAQLKCMVLAHDRAASPPAEACQPAPALSPQSLS